MIKKTISYEDFNGEKVSEDFYFHLSKAEIIELEISEGENGLSGLIQKISKEENRAEIYRLFKKIILMSVGQKSSDGRRFIKNNEIRADFEQSPAFSELFMELGTQADAGAKFVAGLVPRDLGEQHGKQDQDKPSGPPTALQS